MPTDGTDVKVMFNKFTEGCSSFCNITSFINKAYSGGVHKKKKRVGGKLK